MKKHQFLPCFSAIILLLLFFLINPLISEEKRSSDEPLRKLTIEDILKFKIPADPQLSPDGKSVAFTVTQADLEKNRYITHIYVYNPRWKETRQFTSGAASEKMPRWSPDGKYISFLSTRKDKAEKDKKTEKNQIWLIRIDGGEGKKLTSAPKGVITYQWMPHGKEIVYLAEETYPTPVKTLKEKEKKKKIDAKIEDAEKFRKVIWAIDIETRRMRKIFNGDYGISEISISPDGKTISYTTNYTGKENDYTKFDIWTVPSEGGEPRQITDREGGEYNPTWSPDGKYILFTASLDPGLSYSQENIFRVPSEGGKVEILTEDFKQPVQNIHWPKKGNLIYFTAAKGTYNHIYRLSPKSRRITPITTGDKFYSNLHLSPDGKTMAYSLESSTSLPDVWISNTSGKNLRKITDLNPHFSDYSLGSQEVIRWKSEDGLEIEGLLVKPAGYKPGEKYPLLVAVHGGPYGRISNTARGYYNFQVWANEGYAVLAPNFRGSYGYTDYFGILNKADLGGGDYRDIMAGVDHVIDLGLADSERLGVFGGSYGGYMTDWIISQTNRFQGAISMFGIFNFITDFSNSYIPFWEREYLQAYYWEDMTLYLERSPFKYVKNIKTPVLIIHGEADPNTFISNSKEMYTALKTLGMTVEFVRYPREGHGIKEPNHKIDEIRRSIEWFEKYVKNKGKGQLITYKVGNEVIKDDWMLKVISINQNASYAGVSPDGRFLEITFMLENREGTKNPLSLNVEDEILLINSSGEEYRVVGIPLLILAENILIRGKDQSITFRPDVEGKYRVLPLKVTFDIPENAETYEFKLKEFDPVSFECTRGNSSNKGSLQQYKKNHNGKN